VTQCDDIGPLLGAFEDAELEPHEMQEVARHLARCGACENELAAYAALGRELRAASMEPDLDGFAQAVQTRIAKLVPPLRIRLRNRYDSSRERILAGLALGAAALATAALTAVILTPYASRLTARISPAGHVESAQLVEPQASAGRDSRAIISHLETYTPSAGVWSEPENGTTVIWVPDQP
jgi:anti-sigma factor RsiW